MSGRRGGGGGGGSRRRGVSGTEGGSRGGRAANAGRSPTRTGGSGVARGGGGGSTGSRRNRGAKNSTRGRGKSGSEPGDKKPSHGLPQRLKPGDAGAEGSGGGSGVAAAADAGPARGNGSAVKADASNGTGDGSVSRGRGVSGHARHASGDRGHVRSPSGGGLSTKSDKSDKFAKFDPAKGRIIVHTSTPVDFEPSKPSLFGRLMKGSMHVGTSNSTTSGGNATYRDENQVKVVIVGQECGKSTMVERFLTDRFNPEVENTSADKTRKKTIKIDGQQVEFELRNVSGSKEVLAKRKEWFEWADAFIITFSVTSRLTFERVTEFFNDIKSVRERPAVVIAATKADESKRKVTKKEGQELATELQLPYYETSAKTGKNVTDVFQRAVEEARHHVRYLDRVLLLEHYTPLTLMNEESIGLVIGEPVNVEHNANVHLEKEKREKGEISKDIIWDAKDFEFTEILGYGAYGTVYRAAWKHGETPFAIKVLKIEPARKKVLMEEIQNEYDALKRLNHPNIMSYYGLCKNDDGKEVWILTEFCDVGSVYYVMKELKTHLNETQVAYMLRGILSALVYLHDKLHMLHRDLKTHNLLLTSDGQLKLADFGCARVFRGRNDKTNAFIGTLSWMAPEMFAQESYDYKADIWSLGITAYEMAVGDPPFGDMAAVPLYQKLINEGPPKLPSKKKWSDQFLDFMDRCLQIEPQQRASAAQLLQHPFITENSKGPEVMVPLGKKFLDLRAKQKKAWEKEMAKKTKEDLKKEAQRQAAELDKR